MILPPSDFAAAFRAHVVPKLAELCRFHGLLVALEDETLAEARAAINAAAWEANGAYLPEEYFGQLEDWILDALCAAIAKAQSKLEARGSTGVEEWNAAVIEAFRG